VFPIVPPGAQPLPQHLVVVVDRVAEHVEVLHGAVDRRDLDGGDQPHPELRGGVGRVLHPIDRVVIAECEQLDAGGGCRLDHFARSQGSVRVARMALQVERRRVGAQGGVA
jgi:hypothetical protein